jgi:hypothetical protein
VPEVGRSREQVGNHGRAYQIPVEPGWYLPQQKIPLAENRFFQAGNGAENTKEKSRQCFTESKIYAYLPNPWSESRVQARFYYGLEFILKFYRRTRSSTF